MNRRHVAGAGILLLAPMLCHAGADVGLGVSARSDEATIYVPVEVSSFRVEPYLLWRKAAVDGFSEGESRTTALGVGGFGLFEVREQVRSYVGARIGWFENHSHTTSGSFSSSSTQRGYTVQPTLGLEYLITDRISLGAETYLDYSSYENDTVGFESDSESISTGNRLLLRLMF